MKLLMVTNQQNFHNSTKGNMYSYVPVDFYKIEDYSISMAEQELNF